MNEKHRPRPRRAGLKIQLKLAWKLFSLPPREPIVSFEDETLAEPIIEAGYNPANPVPFL